MMAEPFGDELLNGEIFDTLWEAKVLTERWRREYTQVRPPRENLTTSPLWAGLQITPTLT